MTTPALNDDLVRPDLLGGLIDEYFDAGVDEGRDGRNHDTRDGHAQDVRSRIDAALEAQANEIEALRSALRPFADAYEEDKADWDEWDIWENPCALNIKIGDLRRARSALTGALNHG